MMAVVMKKWQRVRCCVYMRKQTECRLWLAVRLWLQFNEVSVSANCECLLHLPLIFFLLSELTSTIGDIDRSLKTTPLPNLMLEKAVLVYLETVIVP